MRAAIAFDTLAYANKLKSAGVEPHIAEVQAEANAEMLTHLIDNTIATKQDLNEARRELKHDIHELRLEVKHDIKNLENKVILRLGTVMTAGIAVLATLMSVLHIAH